MEDSKQVMQTGIPISINKLDNLLPYDLVLTPNQRLCTQLATEFDQTQSRLNKTSWPSLNVLSLSNWLHNQWGDAVAAGQQPCVRHRVLSPDEELELWRQSVSDCYSGVLLARESAAQHIMQAWQSLAHWQLPLDDTTRSSFAFFDDHTFFLECADKFESLCEQQHAISPAKLASILAQLPAQQHGRVLLYEFEEIVPAHQHLFERWQLDCDRGVGFHESYLQGSPDSPGNESKAAAFQFSRKQLELREAAQWAQRAVASDERASVAVIVPDLNSQRALVEDVFSQVFAAGYELPQAQRGVQEFNISAGQSLASQPLVEHALCMLELNFRNIAVEWLPELLHSPFLSTVCADTRNARAELEYRLRNYRSETVSLSSILHEAAREVAGDREVSQRCPSMAKTLTEFRQIIAVNIAAKTALTAQDWLLLFEQQLRCCGWPGARTLDSIEFQQLQHWQEALNSCSRLAAVRFGAAKTISLQQCFDLLSQCCREHVFQAKSAACRVQILGLLEGAGMLFTHTWLSNMGSEYWPAPARPSPYIPMDLQRQHRMPHCDAERELQFSGRLFANYRSHCTELVMSFVNQDGDAQAPASPFLLANASDVRSVNSELESAAVPEFSEAYDVEARLPVTDSEHFAAVASIYEDQAACGFKAFARHRLRIRPPETTAYGLDGRDRGMLLHDSMEAVWSSLSNSETLKASSNMVLESLVAAAVDTAMHLAARRVRFRDSAVFLELERERLQALILQWLMIEAARDDFTVIDFEVTLNTQIAGRAATLRIDRVDRKTDGRLLLIEYKTGKVSEASLLSEPLQAPQLPLYLGAYRGTYRGACLGGDKSDSVLAIDGHDKTELTAQSAAGGVLCRVDSQEPAWLGFGEGVEQNLPRDVKQSSNKVPEWYELKSQWQQALNTLDSAFSNGDVQAEPVHPTQTCRICDYAAVCRYALRQRPGDRL